MTSQPDIEATIQFGLVDLSVTSLDRLSIGRLENIADWLAGASCLTTRPADRRDIKRYTKAVDKAICAKLATK